MKSIREDLRVIWKHTNKYSVSQGNLILKEEEIDFRGSCGMEEEEGFSDR